MSVAKLVQRFCRLRSLYRSQADLLLEKHRRYKQHIESWEAYSNTLNPVFRCLLRFPIDLFSTALFVQALSRRNEDALALHVGGPEMARFTLDKIDEPLGQGQKHQLP